MMRVRLVGALCAMSVVSAAAAPRMLGAQSTFEGVITMHMTAQGMDQDVAYAAKGENVRMDMSMGGMQVFILFNTAKKLMNVMLPMQNMYMERPIDNMIPAPNTGGKSPDVAWTGKKETIAGYECEHATITDGANAPADACLAKNLGAFLTMGGGGLMGGGGGRRGGGPQAGTWQSQLPAGVFPLKVTSGGNVVMEVTNIEKKTLDPALFTVPEGYQKMAMPGGGSQ